MATQQSATAEDIRDELISGMPEGFTDLFDMADPDGPGPLFTALGEAIAETAIDRLDDLRDQLAPTTCSSATLADWEAALALADSRIARAGAVEVRRAQVIARLREWGAPTLDLIRRVVYSYLGYASPADVVIRESDRAALRELHTYRWTGARTIGPASITQTVRDGGTVGAGGVAVDLCASVDELDSCTITVTAPDSTTASRVGIGRGPLVSGRAWSAVSSGVAVGLNGCWGDGSSVWFVGSSGTILRWDGAAIVAETSGVANNLNAVWGDSGVVWAVGSSGVCLKRSGGTWSAVTTGTVQTLLGVWSKGSKVWACGASGTIIYSDDSGATWSALTSGTAVTLRAIWGANVTQLWAVGSSGTILRMLDGGAGRVRVYFPEAEGEDIYGAWTVTVNGDGTGLLSRVDLFVEGTGLDGGGASHAAGLEIC